MAKEPNLRVYGLSDITQIVSLVDEALPTLPNYKGTVVAKDRLEYVLKHNVKGNAGFQCWILETEKNEVVGIAAGYCVQGLISWDYIANDSFLYIKEEWRTLKSANALIGAYKKWAVAKGAKVVIASVRSGYRPEEFASFMKRNGFKKIGDVYALELEKTGLEQELASLKEKE
jgi:hypothetical protein